MKLVDERHMYYSSAQHTPLWERILYDFFVLEKTKESQLLVINNHRFYCFFWGGRAAYRTDLVVLTKYTFTFGEL